LRNNIAELRISKLTATLGADQRSRISMKPFWTKTGRSQPSSDGKVFLPSLPGWLHGLLRPPPGHALLAFDWVAEELVIAAALSGDANLLADCAAGRDPHVAFGIRCGLLPRDADKANPACREIRNKICKPCGLGTLYGMSPHGLAAKTGRSLIWARGIHAQHERLYSTFHRWRGDVVASAQLNGFIASALGWPMAVDGQTRPRSLMNYPIQSSAADCMRLAAIAAAECGIEVCATVHDSFWVQCPIDEVERTTQRMIEIMRMAGQVVTGGVAIEVETAAVVCAPQCLGDVRADVPMWREVGALL
jgi:DNA polymerase I-like protein with 3'-5' exonuclease and polymerase domains